jgi:branched-chain amino acid transport system ATP-binding protein
MDEPSEGLAPAIVDELLETCNRLLAEGIGLLVVEQNLGVAARLADRLLVMVSGRIEDEMKATALLEDEDAQRRYLGVEALAGTDRP